MLTNRKPDDTGICQLPPLTTLYCYISGCCNLSCRHCWISPQSDKESSSFLPLKLLKKAVQQAKPLGLHSVKLTGGEPLLHPNIKDFIQFIGGENLTITIETNGTLIDKKMAVFLKSNQRVTHISVSVDGSSANLHEILRGKKESFNQAIEGINHLVKAGFSPQMICTLHKDNVKDIENIVQLAIKLGCGSIKFNHVQKIGRGVAFARQHGLSVPEVIKIYQHVEKTIYRKSKIPIYFDIPMAFFSIKNLLRDSRKQCTILNILGLLSNGNYSLCGIGESIPELIFGNTEQDNLKDIWQNGPQLRQLRELIPHQLQGTCARCIHRDLCLGACVANNYYRTQKLNSAYYFCEQAADHGLFPKSRIFT